MGAFSIPLQVNAPQPASPLSSVAALMQLRGQMSEIALRSAQAEQAKQNTAQLAAETAQKNRDVADQNHIQEIEKDPDTWAKITSGDFSPLIGKVSDQAIEKVRTGVNANLQSLATRTKDNLANQKAATDVLGKDLASAASNFTKDGAFDADSFNAVLPSFYASHAAEFKALDIDPSQLPTSIADAAHLNLLSSRVKSLSSMLQAAQDIKGKQAETALKGSEASRAQAAADYDNFRLSLLKGSPVDETKNAQLMDQMFAGNPKLRAQADAQYAAGKAAKPLEPGAGIEAVKAFYDEQIGKPQGAAATIAAETPGKLDQANKMIPIQAREAAAKANAEIGPHVSEALKKQEALIGTGTAQMIAEGKLDPATTRSLLRKDPGIISQVKAFDPRFDEANIENRFNTLKEFTNTSTAKAGGQLIALNTLIHHADLYLETARALKNGSFVPGNRIYNEVAQVFGSAPPTNAALVGRFFAGETSKVATGGVPAEGEINGILKNLSTNSSPDQIEGAAKTLLQIAAGRATPLIERAKQARIDNVVPLLGLDAQAILKKNGLDPNTMKPSGSGPITVKANGKEYHFPDQGSADKFREAAKKLGSTVE